MPILKPSTSSRLCPKRLLVPAFISVSSFLVGLLCNYSFPPLASTRELTVFKLPNHTAVPAVPPPPPILEPLSPSQHKSEPAAAPPSPSPAPIGPVQPPLGLQWYKSGYENPWSFSTDRTGIYDLDDAYNAAIDRDGKLPRVVVSFTSLPKRFVRRALPMIQLLKRQTYLPDTIYVCIPKGSRRSEAAFEIPSWLSKDPHIKVLRPEVDMGPATKLIPAIEEELRLGHTHSRVVTVDDDDEGHWTEDSLMQLFAYSLRFENHAIGLTGWNVTCMVSKARCSPEDSGVPARQYRDRSYNFIKQADDYACHSLGDWLPGYFPNCLGAVRKNFISYVDVLEGYKGALYQPRFFNAVHLKTLMNKTKTPEYFFLCDDVWFSGWLSMKQIPRIVVNPAFHDDAPVRIHMKMYSDKRNISREVQPMSKEDSERMDKLSDVEAGLHSLGGNFVQANHDAAVWFEKKGGWVKEMWARPPGFKYPTELKKKTRGDDKAGK